MAGKTNIRKTRAVGTVEMLAELSGVPAGRVSLPTLPGAEAPGYFQKSLRDFNWKRVGELSEPRPPGRSHRRLKMILYELSN